MGRGNKRRFYYDSKPSDNRGFTRGYDSLLLGLQSLSIISTTTCGITRLPSEKLAATVLSENLGESMRGSCVAWSTNVLLSSHLYLSLSLSLYIYL